MGLPIFFVDPLEVVKAHHQRGDAITMLLVLRDPRASLQNKALVFFVPKKSLRPSDFFPYSIHVCMVYLYSTCTFTIEIVLKSQS